MSLWAMDVEGENAKAILPAFRRATGLHVDLQWLPWTAAHQKLLTAYAGGTLPDVFMMSGAWTPEFAMVGAATPLPAALGAVLADQIPGVRAGAQVGGRDLAAPWTVDAAVQYFRRDLLAEAGFAAPPDRLDEWLRMLRAVKRRRPDRFAILMQLNWPDHLIQLGMQQPEPLLRDRQSRGNFGSPGFQARLALYKTLFDEGLAPKVSSLEADDPVGELARGFVAVYGAGAWNRADLLRRTGELPRALWGAAAMPGAEGPGRGVAASSQLAVSRADDPAARARAARLVAYLLAPATQARFFQVAGVLPSSRAAWADPALARDPTLSAFAGQLARAAPMPNVPEWPRITTEVQLIAERMVRGALGVTQAAREMDAAADRLLAKRRWLLDRGLDGGRLA